MSNPNGNNNPGDSDDYYYNNYLGTNNLTWDEYGGYLRDRPLTRTKYPESTPIQLKDSFNATITTGSHRVADKRLEVRRAITAGIDGFMLDILNWENVYDANGNLVYTTGASDKNNSYMCTEMLEAIKLEDPGFIAALWLDFSTGSSIIPRTYIQVAQWLAGKYANYSDVLWHEDGRLIISMAAVENWTTGGTAPTRVKLFIDYMWTQYGIKVAVITNFLNWSANHVAFETELNVTNPNFSGGNGKYMHGQSEWGDRNPLANDIVVKGARVNDTQALGVKWKQPVSVQDYRPVTYRIWDEPENLTNLRKTWQIAIDNDADYVHLCTWSDYTECTPMGPTEMIGWTYVDVSLYYAIKWKTGSYPSIVADCAYMTHRLQPYGASVDPTGPQTLLAIRRGGNNSRPRDFIEVMSFLTAPATIRVSAGAIVTDHAGVAGVNIHTQQLREGTISVQIIRNEAVVGSASYPVPVTYKPYRQNLQYFGTSTLRPTDEPTGFRTFPANERDVVITCTPIADTFVHQSVPAQNYGTDLTLQHLDSPQIYSMLRWLLPMPPLNKTLVSAVLQLTTTSTGGSDATFDISKLTTDTWDEFTVTYNNRPTLTGKTVLGQLVNPVTVSTRYDVTLTLAEIQAVLGQQWSMGINWVSGGADRYLVLHSTRAAVSSQAVNEPRLVLTFQ